MGIVGDGRGWLVGKIQRGEGGSDIVWVESRGAVLDWRDGGEKRERRGFFCDIGFECGIKLVVVIELRKWL